MKQNPFHYILFERTRMLIDKSILKKNLNYISLSLIFLPFAFKIFKIKSKLYKFYSIW